MILLLRVDIWSLIVVRNRQLEAVNVCCRVGGSHWLQVYFWIVASLEVYFIFIIKSLAIIFRFNVRVAERLESWEIDNRPAEFESLSTALHSLPQNWPWKRYELIFFLGSFCLEVAAHLKERNLWIQNQLEEGWSPSVTLTLDTPIEVVHVMSRRP